MKQLGLCGYQCQIALRHSAIDDAKKLFRSLDFNARGSLVERLTPVLNIYERHFLPVDPPKSRFDTLAINVN